MALPANVSFGTVTGRFLTATADSPVDQDRDPEGTAATDLSVVFAPNLSPAVVRDASAVPPTVFALAPVTATVGASGDLLGPDGQAGVRLVATTGTTIDPSGWTWKVTLASPSFPTMSFNFALDPGQAVDLASVVQVPASPGATLDAWLQAVTDAQAARDAARAAAASIPSAAVLAATYLPHPVSTIVYDGDSITQIGGGLPVNPSYNGRGFWCWGQSLASHRLRNLGNVGVAGQTTAGIVARINATLALAPGWVHILAGTNDIGQNVPAATTQANLTAYYNACDAAGVRVMAGTIPPGNGWTTAQQQAQAATNLWLRNQARARRNFVLLDYAAALTDPATGRYLVGYAQADGTHPSQLGAQAMGRLLAESVLSLNPPAPMLFSDPNDPANLLNAAAPGAGRFAAGTWGHGSYLNPVLSTVPRTDGIAGSWQRIVSPTGGDTYMQSPNVDSSGLHGQSFYATVEYALSSLDPAAAANAQAFYLTLQSYNGSGFNASIADLYWDTSYENQGSRARSGVLRTPPFVVPNDSVVLQTVVHLTGGGTYDLDRASISAAV